MTTFTSTLIGTTLCCTFSNTTVMNSLVAKDNSPAINGPEYTVHIPDQLEKRYSYLFNELNGYKNLKENWDGYNGVKPDTELVKTVKLFIENLKNNKNLCPDMMLSGEGDISLFWKSNNKYLELNFDEVNKVSYLLELTDMLAGEDDIDCSQSIPASIQEAISKVSSNVANITTAIPIAPENIHAEDTILVAI